MSLPKLPPLVQVFQIMGYSDSKALLLNSLVVGLSQIFGTLIALLLVERVGRRPLMITGMRGEHISLRDGRSAEELTPTSPLLLTFAGAAVMLACNVAAAAITGATFDGETISQAAGTGLAVALAVFEVSVCFSILSVSWIIASEVR